jgi:hypothetical protein
MVVVFDWSIEVHRVPNPREENDLEAKRISSDLPYPLAEKVSDLR